MLEYVGLEYDEAGFDCWELVRVLYRDLAGLEIGHRSRQAQALADEEWVPIPHGKQQMGDVLVLRGADGEKHVAVAFSRFGRMLHNEKNIGVILERYDEGLWAQRLIGIYRHKALAG